jgi:hypothetical protein
VDCVGLNRFKEDGSGECAFEKWEAKVCVAIENKIGQRLWYEWIVTQRSIILFIHGSWRLM